MDPAIATGIHGGLWWLIAASVPAGLPANRMSYGVLSGRAHRGMENREEHHLNRVDTQSIHNVLRV